MLSSILRHVHIEASEIHEPGTLSVLEDILYTSSVDFRPLTKVKGAVIQNNHPD